MISITRWIILLLRYDDDDDYDMINNTREIYHKKTPYNIFTNYILTPYKI